MKEYNTGKYFLNGHGGGEGHSRHRVRAGFTLDQQSPTFSVPRTGRWVSAETTPTKLQILSMYYIYIYLKYSKFQNHSITTILFYPLTLAEDYTKRQSTGLSVLHTLLESIVIPFKSFDIHRTKSSSPVHTGCDSYIKALLMFSK